jgi:hypothetical protein|tara:strand:- start:2023 stop:2184 length:162 start_codon:yes stop_codon:yes gene_type:complete
MANSFVLLMVLTLEYGWGIAPIKGNPFFNEKTCLETIEDIKKNIQHVYITQFI